MISYTAIIFTKKLKWQTIILFNIADHESTIQHIICHYYNSSHFGTVRMVNASECQ